MRSARRSALGLALRLATVFAVACSAKGGEGSQGSHVDVTNPDGASTDGEVVGQVSCQDDPRVDIYTANLKKSGQNGVLTFVLAQSDPAPPAKGNNAFLIKIAGADGGALGGDLAVSLKMPDHGHGTSVQPNVTFDPQAGSYTVTPLYFFMAGVWRVELDAYDGAADAGTVIDSAVFYFCVEG
jgi:hypothetical protein